MEHHGLPLHLFTLDPVDTESKARIRVDVGQTGFWDGREFRISYPVSVATTSKVVLKVVSPVDFILQRQSLYADEEGFIFQAYRSAQGTQGGTFGTNIPIYANNSQSSAPEYTRQVTITTGGTFTPGVGETPTETVRIRVSTATSKSSTVGEVLQGERGLAAGTYYLVFSNITESATALGVYDLIWEERPPTLSDWLYR